MNTRKITLTIFSIAMLIALAACSAQTIPAEASYQGSSRWTAAQDGTQGAAGPRGGGGRGGWGNPAAQPAAPAIPVNPDPQAAPSEILPHFSGTVIPSASSISQAEADGLIFMQEEEKLARDVYLALYQKWGLPTFQNIASSEQKHMDSVQQLLDAYQITNPASAKAAGQFANPDLQKLYDTLVNQGSQSLTNALKAGAAVEEIDILDLQKRAATTSNTGIIQVYANLEAGSNNHLRTFVAQLQSRANETYQPQYLSTAAYQAITGSAGNGGQAAGQGTGRGGRW